jgi:hypothetical protein
MHVQRLRNSSWVIAFGLACLAAACGGGGGQSTPTPTPTPTVTPTATATPTPAPVAGTFSYEGVSHTSYWYNQYQGSEGSASRSALAATGVNWAGLLVTWYMATATSTAIGPDSQKTPSDAALQEAIAHLHSLNLKVMLKPHVDVYDSTWRGSIAPADTNAWFASYTAYLSRMADFAKAENVEMLCVGTELKTMSTSRYASQWAGVIAAVRERYQGQITYAANATSAADEYSSVSFWNLVDLAGLDGYVPLTAKNDPTIAELIAGWSRNANGDDMHSAFRNWQQSHGKPVIFTEIGYRSMDGTNRAPWDWSATAAYDPHEQVACYQAAFSVWLPERSWLQGFLWWSWDVPVPVADDRGYNPRTKPAENILRAQYLQGT